MLPGASYLIEYNHLLGGAFYSCYQTSFNRCRRKYPAIAPTERAAMTASAKMMRGSREASVLPCKRAATVMTMKAAIASAPLPSQWWENVALSQSLRAGISSALTISTASMTDVTIAAIATERTHEASEFVIRNLRR